MLLLLFQAFSLPAKFDTTAIPALATQVLARYTEADPLKRLDNRFRLEIVTGRYQAAAQSVAQLRATRIRSRPGPQSQARDVQYEIWARAKAASAGGKERFAAAFARVFRQVFARLDNQAAVLAIRTLTIPGLQAAFQQVMQAQSGRREIALADALVLIRAYQRAQTHSEFASLVGPLIAEDDARRYVNERDLRVTTPDGATICALLVRPRTSRRLPALLTFTIYVDSAVYVPEARRAAANGYAGVVGYTRGKACSPGKPAPYATDGKDAAALIDWIAGQSWSDGRVGMYGGSYNGFTTWAATKYQPKALKAIMVGAPVGPGIDVPMEGNIVWNFLYPWPFYTTNNKTLDNATYFDGNRWFRLNREWYVSGKAYADLEKIDGTPNPVWAEWLAHPRYDDYWRSMIPAGDEFAGITIPVLQTAGYFFGGPGAATWYLNAHYQQDSAARHYLVIGPWDHVQGQRGVVSALGDTATVIAGYEIDPVARLDLVADLRYRWFDWILKGGPRPALLQDRINYQVMGANRWGHAPSIAAMANGSLRLPLAPERTFTFDLAYRGDIDSVFPGGGLRDTVINRYGSVVYQSDPLEQSLELNGLFSGHLEFTINKRDFDLSVQLYELTERGEYYMLPPFQIRASHARSLSKRRLLTPGARETLDFTAIRLVSRQLARGSRIVAVLGPLKNPGQQINYGSGKEVNAETVADAGPPLEIKWHGTSYLDLPIRRLP